MGSALPPSFVTRGIPRFRDVLVDNAQPELVAWLEQRPDEEGRTGLFGKRLDAETPPTRLSPAGFDVRSRVHEYGGGAAWMENGRVYASSGKDARLYTFLPGDAEARPITPPGPWRYADFRLDPLRSRLYCVVEIAESSGFPRNALAAVAVDGGAPRLLAEGADFYAAPRPSPDGRRLAWIQWRHPHSPWEATELYVADIDATGALSHQRRVAGGSEAIVDPQWHPDGSLWFSSDRNGLWNLYRLGVDGDVRALPPVPGETALPHWVFGRPLYGFDESGRAFTAAITEGRTALWKLEDARWIPWQQDDAWSTYEPLRIAGRHAVAVASGPYRSASVVLLSTDGSPTRVLREATAPPRTLVDYVATTERLPRRDGGDVHAFVYRPTGATRPHAIVSVHGGPTAQASFSPDATVLFWLSQGFAWVDVNYGGSTGYGRDYRDRLRHRWGDVDVADCEDVAKALAERSLVGALAIRGGSAGGYTALRAVAGSDRFAAATSAYGVTDLALLFEDTHKFEAHYGQWLLGTTDKTRLAALSPAAAPEALRTPVLFLQGMDDKVVPPAQSEALYRALVARGLPAEYVPFDGEGHGFRRADTIEKALATELAFYRRTLR